MFCCYCTTPFNISSDKIITYHVALTYGAVGRRPARQTLTVAVPVVACGVVGTVNTHLRAEFAIKAGRTDCKTDSVTCEMTYKMAWLVFSLYTDVLCYLCLFRPWSQLSPVCPGRQSQSPVTWWQRYVCPQDGHCMLHCSPYVPARHSGKRREETESEPGQTYCSSTGCDLRFQQHSLVWQVTPQKPGRHTHAPVSLWHVSLLGQRLKQDWLQWRPHMPSGHGSLHREPAQTNTAG